MRISALEMYNHVETNKANQEFYSKISQQLIVQKINAPKTLMYTQDQLKYWKSKDLFGPSLPEVYRNWTLATRLYFPPP